LVQVAGDALAVLEIDVAGLGKAELAGRAVEQLGAEPVLQLLHLAADRGLGQAQRARGADEAAQFDHLDENQGVVEIAGHREPPWHGWADWPGDGTIIPRFAGKSRAHSGPSLIPTHLTALPRPLVAPPNTPSPPLHWMCAP